jgi:hypothetical protein
VNKALFAVVALLLSWSQALADQPTTRPVSEVAKSAMVTLSVKNATVKSILDAMEKQTKLKATISAAQQGVLDARVTLELEGVPWLEALMQLCEAANLNPMNYGDRWTLSPHGTQRMFSVRDVRGAAMVALSNAAVETNITFDQTNRNTRQLTLSGLLCVEPSLDIDSISSLSELSVIDDQGRTLSATARGSSSSAMANFRRDFSITADLPDGAAKQLRSVRGTLIAPMLASRKQLTIPNLLASEGKTLPLAGGNVKVEEVRRRSPQIFEVELRFDRGVLPDAALARLRSNASRHLPRQTHASDPANLRVQRITERDDAVTFVLYVQFHRVPKNEENEDNATEADRMVNFSWDLPVSYVDVSIPFEMKDIPLP